MKKRLLSHVLHRAENTQMLPCHNYHCFSLCLLKFTHAVDLFSPGYLVVEDFLKVLASDGNETLETSVKK